MTIKILFAPDLTKIDFWGQMKTRVHQEIPTTANDVKSSWMLLAVSIIVEMLINVAQSCYSRMKVFNVVIQENILNTLNFLIILYKDIVI